MGNPEAHNHEIGNNNAESPQIAKYSDALKRIERDPLGDIRGIQESSEMSVFTPLNLQWFRASRQSLSYSDNVVYGSEVGCGCRSEGL